MRPLSRRHAALLGLSAAALPGAAFGVTPREITWDDLIPPGVPYGQIIGEGELDEINDTWRPIFDANATRLNEALDGVHVRLPGYIVPLDFSARGTKEFILVPYVGACIHIPPPPPNQLVLVQVAERWPMERMWDAVWVEGQLRTQLAITDIADTGYAMTADHMELYQW